jgi:hypothetical protein
MGKKFKKRKSTGKSGFCILMRKTFFNGFSRIKKTQGRTQPPPPPPKIGKNMIFWCKIVIFHTKYSKNFRASLRNWKKYDFLA